MRKGQQWDHGARAARPDQDSFTEADSICALACRALVGLACSPTATQIMSKLPIFSDGVLSMLLREPVLQDRRSEHLKFQQHAHEFIAKVSSNLSCLLCGATSDISIYPSHLTVMHVVQGNLNLLIEITKTSLNIIIHYSENHGEQEEQEEQGQGNKEMFSNNYDEQCMVRCKICNEPSLLSTLRYHISKEHNSTITEYKETYGTSTSI